MRIVTTYIYIDIFLVEYEHSYAKFELISQLKSLNLQLMMISIQQNYLLSKNIIQT